MDLPNAANAYVEQGKIVDYLLAPEHPEGAGKAAFFDCFGFTIAEWQVLAEALLAQARAHPVASMAETRYGTKYLIEGAIVCPDGRAPSIRTVWIIDCGADEPRLVTAHPIQ